MQHWALQCRDDSAQMKEKLSRNAQTRHFSTDPQRSNTEQAQSKATWALIVPLTPLLSANATKSRSSLSRAPRGNPSAFFKAK